MAGARGTRGPGRPKGSPNKITADIKAAILEAFHNKGGVKYLEKVAEEDMKTFCGLLGKALPLQISGDPENPLQNRMIVEFVTADSNPRHIPPADEAE